MLKKTSTNLNHLAQSSAEIIPIEKSEKSPKQIEKQKQQQRNIPKK